ncbi:U-Kazal-Dg21.2-like [Leguminivora glycinivorella]|uniref:U-Kazal-Dg21.2-like n=1 Tax=Leguminivora glycinivorella TaxID=1035111 RepID=UPI00200EF42C|nr:U-Kazal-Dg21.2-like [Leguminivora glycinivorella]
MRFLDFAVKMIFLCLALTIVFLAKPSHGVSCDAKCPEEKDVVCGFDALGKTYKMFPGKCAMQRYIACEKVELVTTPISYCIKNERRMSKRRHYMDQSCPVFCPQHYRPVCGMSKSRAYEYRSFTNGCQLDMLNCRGQDEYSGYMEVPLSFCPRHMYRNIFKDRIIAN